MAVPEVRVRLSAEGQAELVAALGRVKDAGVAAAKAPASQFAKLNGIVAQSTKLFGAFGVAVGVGALVSLARAAADGADALQEAAESVGATSEELAGLSGLARLNGVDFNSFTQTLGIFSRKLTDLRSGVPAAVSDFKKLNLTAKAFDGKGVAESITLVAERIAALPDGTNKAGLAIDLLGRKGRALVPFLNALGNVGLEGTIENARKLGLVLDDEVIAAAGRVSDELSIMQTQAMNLATAFIAGLSPAIHQSFLAINDDVEGGADEWEKFGRGVGKVLGALVFIVTATFDTIGAILDQVAIRIALAGVLVQQAFRGQFQNLPKAADAAARIATEKLDAFIAKQKRKLEILDAAAAAPATRAAGGDGGDPVADPSVARARAAARKAIIDNQLKATLLALKLEEEAEERRFKNGLIDVHQFYETKRRLIEATSAAEIEALTKRRALEDRGTPEGRLEASNLTEEIARKEIERRGAIAAAVEKEFEATEQLADRRLAFETKMLEAEGRRHALTIRDIDIEAEKFREVLTQLGGDPDVEGTVAKFRATLTAAADFQRQVDAFGRSMADVNRERERVAALVAAGLKGERAGNQEILEIEKLRVAELSKIAALAVAAARATGDPEKIQQAQEMVDAVAQLGIAASESARVLASFGDVLIDQLGTGLTSALSGGADGFKSLKEAGLDALGALVQAMRRLLAQAIALKILETLAGAFGGGGKVAIAPNPGVPLPTNRVGGKLEGYSIGGRIRGPGTGTSDSILGMVGNRRARFSNGEFVIRESVVRQPGVEPHLAALNGGIPLQALVGLGAGLAMPQVAAAAPKSAYAEGGPIGVSATTKVEGGITVGLEDGLVERALESKRGQAIILRTLTRNRRAANRALGGRG